MRNGFNLRGIAVLAVAAAVTGSVPSAIAGDHDIFGRTRVADISGDPKEPRRHFRVRDTADLNPADAEAVYNKLSGDMAMGYRISGDIVAKSFRGWQRANTAPYISSSHGRRYLNNFVNAEGAAYLKFETAGRLPVGSIIAKESFSVSTDGKANVGPLFLMEKMSKGFNYVSGDWRYSMIMPDGQIFGVTKGKGSRAVKFCISCHLAKERQDHLFFLPKAYRRKKN